jgi:DNA-binding Lrp family transcriptional regulator
VRVTDPEIQAQVTAALMAGIAVNEAARRYKLSPATVSRIKANLDQDGLKHIETESRRRIDDMLVLSVQSHLDALKGISEVAQDKKYLLKQSPEGLATLHQRIEDHAFRLLESAGSITSGEDEPSQ